jgi:hypothetical protein
MATSSDLLPDSHPVSHAAQVPHSVSLPSAASFSEDELQCAVKVINALKQDQELYQSKALQPFRRGIMPLVKWHMDKMFGGGTEAEYKESLTLKRKRAAERLKRQQMDKAHMQRTTLRAGRLKKLAELSGQAEGSALPLIPDGAVDSARAGPYELLEDAAEESAAGANTVAAADQEVYGNRKRSARAAGLLPASEKHNVPAEPETGLHLNAFRSCYICKRRFQQLHHFYDTLCPQCATLNWEKRHQTADLTGRVALVTGARVKIGFQCAVKLLRCGASVIATSRFPHDAAVRFAALPDFEAWKTRLHVFGIDFRNIAGLEALCAMIDRTYDRLDIIINNACQTVRRPPAYYAPMLEKEGQAFAALPEHVQPILSANHAMWSSATLLLESGGRTEYTASSIPDHSSAAQSQLALLVGDDAVDTAHFPEGKFCLEHSP